MYFLSRFVAAAFLLRKSCRLAPQGISMTMRALFRPRRHQGSTNRSQTSSGKPPLKFSLRFFQKCNPTLRLKTTRYASPSPGRLVRRTAIMEQSYLSLFRIEKCFYKWAMDWKRLFPMHLPSRLLKTTSSLDLEALTTRVDSPLGWPPSWPQREVNIKELDG